MDHGGDHCLICFERKTSTDPNIENGATFAVPEINKNSKFCLTTFILRDLLEVPFEQLERHSDYGIDIRSESWITLCSSCCVTINKAKNTFRTLVETAKLFYSVKTELIDKVKESAALKHQADCSCKDGIFSKVIQLRRNVLQDTRDFVLKNDYGGPKIPGLTLDQPTSSNQDSISNLLFNLTPDHSTPKYSFKLPKVTSTSFDISPVTTSDPQNKFNLKLTTPKDSSQFTDTDVDEPVAPETPSISISERYATGNEASQLNSENWSLSISGGEVKTDLENNSCDSAKITKPKLLRLPDYDYDVPCLSLSPVRKNIPLPKLDTNIESKADEIPEEDDEPHIDCTMESCTRYFYREEMLQKHIILEHGLNLRKTGTTPVVIKKGRVRYRHVKPTPPKVLPSVEPKPIRKKKPGPGGDKRGRGRPKSLIKTMPLSGATPSTTTTTTPSLAPTASAQTTSAPTSLASIRKKKRGRPKKSLLVTSMTPTTPITPIPAKPEENEAIQIQPKPKKKRGRPPKALPILVAETTPRVAVSAVLCDTVENSSPEVRVKKRPGRKKKHPTNEDTQQPICYINGDAPPPIIGPKRSRGRPRKHLMKLENNSSNNNSPPTTSDSESTPPPQPTTPPSLAPPCSSESESTLPPPTPTPPPLIQPMPIRRGRPGRPPKKPRILLTERPLENQDDLQEAQVQSESYTEESDDDPPYVPRRTSTTATPNIIRKRGRPKKVRQEEISIPPAAPMPIRQSGRKRSISRRLMPLQGINETRTQILEPASSVDIHSTKEEGKNEDNFNEGVSIPSRPVTVTISDYEI